MVLTTKQGTKLDDYYDPRPVLKGCCNDKSKTCCLRLSPYDKQETIYWFIKHLTLPGVAVALIIIILILRLFDNPIFDSTIYILGIVAGFFLLSIARERGRSIHYKIKEGRINDKIIIWEVKATREEDQEEYPEEFTVKLNTITKTDYTIGFVGDIMMMKDYGLEFDEDIVRFFGDVNLIVGNLEGITSALTDNPPITKQRHRNPPILDLLGTLLSNNAKWLLCVSNNHSIDFSNHDFHDSLEKIQKDPRFDVFGRNDVPNVVVEGKKINIASATEWSNQKNWECISRYKENNRRNQKPRCDDENYTKFFHCKDMFNILFPHWGYENEKYVRTRVQKDAIGLITGKSQEYSPFQKFIRILFRKKITPSLDKKWDFIFGQHSHVRQPIMKIEDPLKINGNEIPYKRLVAFSGGNFTSGANIIRKKKHIYGIIMKCKIGPLKDGAGKLAMGEVKWRRTVNKKEDRTVNGKTVEVKKIYTDKEVYRTYNIYSLIIGFVLLGIVGCVLLINWITTLM